MADKCPKCGAELGGHLRHDERKRYTCGSRVLFWTGEFDEGKDCLRRQLTALQTIVDRLPKTADGAPISTGMTLYSEARTSLDAELVVHEWRSCALWHLGEWYSTREAALAKSNQP